MTKEKTTNNNETKLVGAKSKRISTRGRIFEGIVIRKFNKRITIEFERMNYIRKYERYAQSKAKVHARLPEEMEDKVKVGDLVKVQECRPLSKIIHSVVIEKLKDASEILGGKK